MVFIDQCVIQSVSLVESPFMYKNKRGSHERSWTGELGVVTERERLTGTSILLRLCLLPSISQGSIAQVTLSAEFRSRDDFLSLCLPSKGQPVILDSHHGMELIPHHLLQNRDTEDVTRRVFSCRFVSPQFHHHSPVVPIHLRC